MRNPNGNIGKGIVIEGFASLLKSVREFKGYSARQMAIALRVPPNTYWRAEGGSAVLLNTAWRIACRMQRWNLPAKQAATLQEAKERMLAK